MPRSSGTGQTEGRNRTIGTDLPELRDIRSALDNTSRVARLADALRQKIIDGHVPPGTQLTEQELSETLGVSRNTLREAFRLLSHEGLLEHQVHRGVFVRALRQAEVAEIYTTRRIVECAALQQAGPDVPVTAVRAAVTAGQQAVADTDWNALGTADLTFHSAITALAGSRHLDELMRRMLAELRLAFHAMSDPERFHAPYLRRNEEITVLLERGDRPGAITALQSYLDDAERQLLAGMAERDLS